MKPYLGGFSMQKPRFTIFKKLMVAAVLLVLSSWAVLADGSPEQVDYMTFEGRHKDVWKLEASQGLLIGGYGDNFNYDGSKVVPIDGTATVELNAKENTGLMEVSFTGTITPEKGKTYAGDIRVVYDEFDDGSEFWEGGIADFVWLHGDTGQEAPVMPKIRAYLSTWGPADIYVDGELIYENLVGHMMYTEGSRDKETFAIYNESGSGYYSPKDPSNGSIAHPDETEIHFVAHTVDPDEGNFPPHTVWLHLNFRDVEEIR
jgi:hypothetical protein